MAWYKQGTIAVNGTTVTGTGTNWTDNKAGVGEGQALLIPGNGVVKMYEIARVNSATSMTLDTDAGTVPAGSAYAILSFYTESRPDFNRRLAAQLAYYQAQMDGWQNIMTGTGSIVIEAPDGTVVTISSFKKLTDDVAAVDDEIKKLTDDVAGKVNKGELGSAAYVGIGEGIGQVLTTNSYGLGAKNMPVVADIWDKSLGTRFCNVSPATSGGTGAYGTGFRLSDRNIGSGGTPSVQQSFVALMLGGGRMQFMTMADGDSSNWRTVYHNSNTTIDANGFLKAASPIVQLFSDGTCELNEESEGVSVKRINTGQYLINGCLGLNSDAAWGGIDGGFSLPLDRNNQPKIWLDYSVNADGSVLVKTFHRTHPAAPKFAQNSIEGLNEGDPVDIPADQFVSVRVNMPDDSAWSKQQKISVMPDVE